MSGQVRESPLLLVAWHHEVGGLAERLIRSLECRFGAELMEEVDGSEFFALDGVNVRGDVIQFPVSRFLFFREANTYFLQSHAPNRGHYDFLTKVLDFAMDRCGVRELCTIGGVVSAITHLSPRHVFGIVNHPELKETLAHCDVQANMNYETPSGGGTSMSNFLLWVAKTRGLPGCTLWVEVPFYLAATQDPNALRRVFEVLNCRFDMGLDLQGVGLEVQRLDRQIDQLRAQNHDIARYLDLLERGIMLDEVESQTLAREVGRSLRRME